MFTASIDRVFDKIIVIFAQIMASVLRFGGLRFINVTEQSLLNVRKYQPCLQQACFISGKTLRGTQKLVKAKPYDYKNKGYNLLNAIFDKTTYRMDENSKVNSTDKHFVSAGLSGLVRQNS